MSIKKIIVFSLVFVILLSSFVFALEREPEQIPANSIPQKKITTKSDNAGLQEISYVISSTRLNNNSTTTYRTDEIYVDIGEKTFVIPSNELEKISPKSQEGTLYHLVTITRRDLEKFLENEGVSKDMIEKYLNEPSKIDIRAKIDIYQNGKVVHSIAEKDELKQAKKYGFTDKHIKDMETRFKEGKKEPINIPTGEEKVPETKGLRPTILIDKSIRDRN